MSGPSRWDLTYLMRTALLALVCPHLWWQSGNKSPLHRQTVLIPARLCSIQVPLYLGAMTVVFSVDFSPWVVSALFWKDSSVADTGPPCLPISWGFSTLCCYVLRAQALSCLFPGPIISICASALLRLLISFFRTVSDSLRDCTHQRSTSGWPQAIFRIRGGGAFLLRSQVGGLQSIR